MTIKKIFFSWDFIFAVLLTAGVGFVLPKFIETEFTHDLYGIGINVLSIIFAIYFAALAIITASSDDDFVLFLEEENDFTKLVHSFRFSLSILFISLVYSILIYSFTAFRKSNDILVECNIFFILFTFLFSYSLFATANSALDSINYAKFRAKFLKLKPKK